MGEKEPITAGELIELLKKVSPTAVVLIDCEDFYYNGPLTSEKLIEGEAVRLHRGWALRDEEVAQGREVLERQPCIRIVVGNSRPDDM